MTDPAYVDLIARYADHHGVDTRAPAPQPQQPESLHAVMRRARAQRGSFLRALARRLRSS